MTPEQRRQQLDFIFNGAAVLRFHTSPPVRPQTDGQHSFGVAWLCYMLTDGRPGTRLILAALAHDLAEYATGDVPAQTKRQNGIGVQLEAIETVHRLAAGLDFPLNPEEQRILNLADNLEGMLFCVSEMTLGNQSAILWFRRWSSYVNGLGPFGDTEKQLLEIILSKWEAVCPTTIPLTYGR